MKNLVVVFLLLVGGGIWLMRPAHREAILRLFNGTETKLAEPREKLPVELIKDTKPSVVHLIVRDEAGEAVSECSGFVVAPPEPNAYARVVTNRHCLDVFGAARAEAVLPGDATAHPIRYLVGEDFAHDLVKVSIELPGSAVPPLPLTDKLPEQGESIFVIGSPFGIPGIVTTGTVAGTPVLPEIGSVILTDAPTGPGGSGGVMVNARGTVLGVITFGVGSLNFALPASRVLAMPARKPQLLSEWLRARQEERIEIEEMQEQLREFIEQILNPKTGPVTPEVQPGIELPPTPEPPQPPKPPRPEQIPDPRQWPTPPGPPKPFDPHPIPKLPPTPKPLEQMLDPEWQRTSPGDVLRQEAGERIRKARGRKLK